MEVVRFYYDTHPHELGEILCETLKRQGSPLSHRQFNMHSFVVEGDRELFEIRLQKDKPMEILERFLDHFPDVSVEGLLCDNFDQQRCPGTIDSNSTFAVTLFLFQDE